MVSAGMDPVQQAFRSLVALIGVFGGGACFGFLAFLPPPHPAVSIDVPRLERAEPQRDGRPVVIVDAGHGGMDGGASEAGLLEKNLTLGMARQLGVELERHGIRVIQTREADVTLSLEERTRFANRHPEALLVSLHFNTSMAPEVEGLETYYTAPKSPLALAAIKRRFGIDTTTRLHDDRSRLLAEKVQGAVVAEVECADRGARNKSLWVTREPVNTAILVECAYLTSSADAERLRSRSYRAALARGIATGVRAYLDAASGSGDRLYGLVRTEGPAENPVAVAGETD